MANYTTIDDPSAFFQCTLYVGDGNGSGQAITHGGNSDLQADWIWIKNRTDAENHSLTDSVRGGGKGLLSNSSDAESNNNSNGYLSSFNSDGFTTANAGVYNNANAKNYVSWNWKAGTSVSGNTGGSGTAKTYTGSVNTDAGFSIIRYIGNSTAGHTIPHHLGTTPAWIICRTISAAKEWDVYHHKLASSPERDYIVLNTNAAAAGATDAADKWNNTAPTSSVVTLGDSSQLNTNDGTCIMYAFSERKGYSKFSSYTGNGNADGPMIWTGFKPAFVLIKVTSTTNDWEIHDNKRGSSNVINAILQPNLSDAESTSGREIDFLSNGFKLRNSNSQNNLSGGTFIYMAFAESPFVTGASAIPTTAR